MRVTYTLWDPVAVFVGISGTAYGLLPFQIHDEEIWVPVPSVTDADLIGLLRKCRKYVQQDVQMIADLTRHAPLPPEEQLKHDTTEYESERLILELDQLLGKA